MEIINVNYVDLANIAALILKEGTVVEDGREYIIGFSKDLNMPILIHLWESQKCISISTDCGMINDKIASYYMKGGVYAKIDRMSDGLWSKKGVQVYLYNV